ncbi:MAG: hypothetical protein IKW46_00505 [Bacteroidaceae bacterium]|nr:hypothetical protein [Bacteroidaceae bacterium]
MSDQIPDKYDAEEINRQMLEAVGNKKEPLPTELLKQWLKCEGWSYEVFAAMLKEHISTLKGWLRPGKRIPERKEASVRRFIKRRIEQEQGSSVVSLAENQEGSWTYTMPSGMHAMMEPLAKRIKLSVPDAISRVLLDWCQRQLSWSVDRQQQQRSLIHEEHNAARIEELLKQMVDHEELKLAKSKTNLSNLQKLKEAASLPDVIRLLQDQIMKVETNLKDLQESYECAKTYTQLVKQDLARIPSRQ